MFAEYDRLLGCPFSEDYWSDEGVLLAVNALFDFEGKDWDELANAVPARPVEWLIRCADTLGDVRDDRASGLLIRFLRIENEDLQVASLDSINALSGMGVQFGEHRSELVTAMKHVKTEGRVVALMMESLLKKLR